VQKERGAGGNRSRVDRKGEGGDRIKKKQIMEKRRAQFCQREEKERWAESIYPDRTWKVKSISGSHVRNLLSYPRGNEYRANVAEKKRGGGGFWKVKVASNRRSGCLKKSQDS